MKAAAAHTSITVRNLPLETKERLRVRAAMHGKSMEAEIRDILKNTLYPENEQTAKDDYAARIASVRGSWKHLGITTDEIMELTRGE